MKLVIIAAQKLMTVGFSLKITYFQTAYLLNSDLFEQWTTQFYNLNVCVVAQYSVMRFTKCATGGTKFLR